MAHKVYGIPQTINSAGYVYFLAFQELQRIQPRRPNYKIEEGVTSAYSDCTFSVGPSLNRFTDS